MNQEGKKRDNLKIAVYCAIFGLVGGISFFGAQKVADSVANKSTNSVKKESTETPGIMNTNVVSTGAINVGHSGVSKVVETVLPSIVQVHVTAQINTSSIFGGQQESTGSGSGIIMSKKAEEILIVTNNHVIADSKKVEVQFCDDEKVSATVKGTNSNSDLAVLSVKLADIKKETLSNIDVIEKGDSDSLKVGEQAIAIGNALGYGQSVTVGYISAKDREISMEDGSMKLLQTDAAINPGNSGGALVNAKGELIGINSAKFAAEEVEGMGFAIPISSAIPIINELMEKEYIPEAEQAYLGIKGRDVTEEYTRYYNIPTGIYIGEVTKGSPAEKAGLRVGYIITALNGKSVKTVEDMQEILSGCRAGSKGSITVQIQSEGGYKKETLDLTFGSKSKSSESNEQNN